MATLSDIQAAASSAVASNSQRHLQAATARRALATGPSPPGPGTELTVLVLLRRTGAEASWAGLEEIEPWIPVGSAQAAMPGSTCQPRSRARESFRGKRSAGVRSRFAAVAHGPLCPGAFPETLMPL
jgi:hypothetical protein